LAIQVTGGGLGRAAAEPGPTPAAVQEIVLTTPWRLQDAGEVQGTVSTDRARHAESWDTALGVEYGVFSRLQLAVERAGAAEGEPATWEAEALVDPGLAHAGRTGRFVLGAAHAWRNGAAPATSDLFAVGGFASPRFELHVEARAVDVFGAPHGAASVAATRGAGRWAAILEASHEAGEAGTLRLSPGLAWHPGAGFELTTGVPIRLGAGRVEPGVALRLSGEREVIR
jgi:hypothetical protein